MSVYWGKERLRVALVVGTLGQGGAEKQVVYLARALVRAGVEVRLFCLTKGEHYEAQLASCGVNPIFVGRYRHPPFRLASLASRVAAFRPHVIQATHFYTNLYVALLSKMFRVLGFGSIRNDTVHELQANGRWGPWLLRAPSHLIANSHAARHNAERFGVGSHKIHYLSNVIDLQNFDAAADQPAAETHFGLKQHVVMAVGRLVEAKRFDRFLQALAAARRRMGELHGVLVGDGPARAQLEAQAGALGLSPDAITFLGRRDDVPAILRRAGVFLLSSEREGFPNVILEAMAAGLPVITTPAGDSGDVVRHGETGYVVPHEEASVMAEHLVRLARSPELSKLMGDAGRKRIERDYTCDALAEKLFAIYDDVARRHNLRRWSSDYAS